VNEHDSKAQDNRDSRITKFMILVMKTLNYFSHRLDVFKIM